jgi:hypothetical protein
VKSSTYIRITFPLLVLFESAGLQSHGTDLALTAPSSLHAGSEWKYNQIGLTASASVQVTAERKDN